MPLESTPTEEAITLGEFIKNLVALLQDEQVQMPLNIERPWHSLFYALKTSEMEGKPSFLDQMRFDWDGPYPKSPELAQFLQALHCNASVSTSNPYYDYFSLPKEVAQNWRSRAEALGEPLKEFLSSAVALATEEFSAC